MSNHIMTPFNDFWMQISPYVLTVEALIALAAILPIAVLKTILSKKRIEKTIQEQINAHSLALAEAQG